MKISWKMYSFAECILRPFVTFQEISKGLWPSGLICCRVVTTVACIQDENELIPNFLKYFVALW